LVTADATTKDDRVVLRVRARVNDDATREVAPPIYLFGPGDVLSIKFDTDPNLVAGRWPPKNAPSAEPDFFPTIEFSRPDLPWAFSPVPADANDHLTPWIGLIALELGEGRVTPPGTGQPLPTVTVKAGELPDLTEAWAWAHVQVIHDPGEDPLALFETAPERVVARLICPQKLKPQTRYVACVVPVFEAGRVAGLGSPASLSGNAAPKLAWTIDDPTASVLLPVYTSWEFSTGLAGDFETLVRLLQHRALPVSPDQPVGTRVLDMSQAFAGLSLSTPLAQGGALGVTAAAPLEDAPQSHVVADFQSELRALITGTASAPGLALAPPSYGQWHAAAPAKDPTRSATAPWLEDLNLDPRYRVAAALGTRVIQQQQETLVASAWRQVGAIVAANQLIRQSALAARVGERLHAALFDGQSVRAETMVALTSPVHLLVHPGPNSKTVTTAVVESRVPRAALTAGFRRVFRPRGPLARRTANQPSPRWSDDLLARLNAPRSANSVVTTRDALALVPASAADHDVRTALVTLTTGPKLTNFPTALAANTYAAMRSRFRTRVSSEPVRPPLRPALDFAALADALRTALNPQSTVLSDLNARLELPGGALSRLETVMAAPEFAQPMCEALVGISYEWLLPGVGSVPPNTIAALLPNPAFIEAFMVGLSHEMGRELTWRGFPTDQRGTYFRQFWDPSGRIPTPSNLDDLKDLKGPIHGWHNALGKNIDGSAGTSSVVLLIRGELLQRYPRASIFAIPAVPGTSSRIPSSDSTLEEFPQFRAFLAPDATFLGFDLSAEDAIGGRSATDLGYYFVIEQPQIEPRFGLDSADPTQTGLTSWQDLRWSDVATREGGQIDLSEGLLAGRTAPTTSPSGGGTAACWGITSTAAELAEITL
jgi:hypothetical protein